MKLDSWEKKNKRRERVKARETQLTLEGQKIEFERLKLLHTAPRK